MSKFLYASMAVIVAAALTACTNIFTYIRHDVSSGNIQCADGSSSPMLIKRDNGTCNASTNQESSKKAGKVESDKTKL